MRLTAGPAVLPSSVLADARGLAPTCGSLVRTNDDLARTYDDLARTYDANRGCFDMTDVLADWQTRLPAQGDLLDLGCGAGEPFAAAFVARGWRVTGVDFSGAMLALAARYVPAMQRIEADLRHVDFPGGSFDAVEAIYSLFHVPAVDHPALFARVRRWLRPRAIFLFTYATQAYTGHECFDGWKTFMGRELYYSHVAPAELLGQLAVAGLELVAARDRTIGGETFLWVTAAAPASASVSNSASAFPAPP